MPDTGPIPTVSPQNGWNQYQRLVMSELERLDKAIEKAAASGATATEKARDEVQKAIEKLGEANGRSHAEIMASVNANKLEITKLQMKAGLWGAAAGLLPAVAVALFWLAKGS